jgi:hypothetical protein
LEVNGGNLQVQLVGEALAQPRTFLLPSRAGGGPSLPADWQMP